MGSGTTASAVEDAAVEDAAVEVADVEDAAVEDAAVEDAAVDNRTASQTCAAAVFDHTDTRTRGTLSRHTPLHIPSSFLPLNLSPSV